MFAVVAETTLAEAFGRRVPRLDAMGSSSGSCHLPQGNHASCCGGSLGGKSLYETSYLHTYMYSTWYAFQSQPSSLWRDIVGSVLPFAILLVCDCGDWLTNPTRNNNAFNPGTLATVASSWACTLFTTLSRWRPWT